MYRTRSYHDSFVQNILKLYSETQKKNTVDATNIQGRMPLMKNFQ